MIYMLENTLVFRIKTHKIIFVNYPKEGYSDNIQLTKNNNKSYSSFPINYFLKMQINLICNNYF